MLNCIYVLKLDGFFYKVPMFHEQNIRNAPAAIYGHTAIVMYCQHSLLCLQRESCSAVLFARDFLYLIPVTQCLVTFT